MNTSCLTCGTLIPAGRTRCTNCTRARGRSEAARLGRNTRIYNTAEWKRARAQALRAGNHQCADCGSQTSLHVHHIIHLGQGGTNEQTNLQVLCASCHGGRHGG